MTATQAYVNGSYMALWLESVMRKWHSTDPVDATEQARNEAIYAIQV